MTLPIADGPWWQHSKLSDGITLFEEPFVDPWLQPNSWLVEGRERNLLVDSGMGLMSLKDALGPLTEKPLLAVASHTHFDHVGSITSLPNGPATALRPMCSPSRATTTRPPTSWTA